LEIKKTAEKYNPLLKRREIQFLVNHTSLGTPKLFEVKKELVSMYGALEETVFITEMNTLTGTNQTRGKVEVYDDSERAKQLVPQYIRSRNISTRNEKKGEKPAKKGKEEKKKS
jgi:small subunit ribosomal protein S24e